MLTYSEIIELRDKLADGKIGLELAKEKYWADFDKGKRSWHAKDWKERRSKIIKDACQICSSKEALTLQHLSHPRKYSEYERDIIKAYTKAHIDEIPEIEKEDLKNHILKNYEYDPIPLCPNCLGRKPNIRISKLPQYLCTQCRIEFEKPVHRSIDDLINAFLEKKESIEVRDKCFVTRDQWRNKHNLSNIKYWLQRQQATIKSNEAIQKEALLLYLNDIIKYLSFDETITACKRCAFNFDINNLEICPKCRVFYKGVQYQTCIQCLPEDKRKAALEKIEYGKQLRAMHKRFGID